MDMEKKYTLRYDRPAPDSGEGFENWSLPIGNGYMGISVFGDTAHELLSLCENSMHNPTNWKPSPDYGPEGDKRMRFHDDGLNTLSKIYLDFPHPWEQVSNYERKLLLSDAVATVSYDFAGVSYLREYFCSYPDKVAVLRLSASQPGKLSFTLRPTAPYVRDYVTFPGDGRGKTGTVTAWGNTLTVAGTMQHFHINYEGQLRVFAIGGTMNTGTDRITVENADSVMILVAVGTNYHMMPEVFLAADDKKLDPGEFPHEKVTALLDAAQEKTYRQLLDAHLADYQSLFDRVDLCFGGEDSGETTDRLLEKYRAGVQDPYLEALLFHYGRYMLISSMRPGCLPANLQGVWNYYESVCCGAGYWHNINIQLNSWPLFNTGLQELFRSYAEYYLAYLPKARDHADRYLEQLGAVAAAPGENGWILGTGANPYTINNASLTSHSGVGNGPLTALLFWDWYEFTQDTTLLRQIVYPALEGMSLFLSKTVADYDGKLLVTNSASPENAGNRRTVGTSYDQQMIWENHYATQKAAQILGYTPDDHPVLRIIAQQLDKLDPAPVGASGQIKEYREENFYGEFGQKEHRHISQLVSLYPGVFLANGNDSLRKAARKTLELRGPGTTGWSIVHRMLCWARLGDGESAFKRLQFLITERLMPNLWNDNIVFQVDGNFGYTAAVAEMLLQSHDGIALLPALPAAWHTGSFRGLTARGNFSVDAQWESGKLTFARITANTGGACTVRYPGIEKMPLTGGTAKPGKDRLCLQIEKGQSVTIQA